MMHRIALWAALLAAPFWEAKSPPDWTEAELRVILTDSPWAQSLEKGGAVGYLATARPMQDAERELTRRRRAKSAPPADPEYEDFLAQDQGKHIVLAVALSNPAALADAREARRMQEESILKVGKKKYKMTGHFPPTPDDPCLRLIYPREIGTNDRSLVFELYLPGVSGTFKTLEFRMKELLYHGQPEM
jgi:hypothetical protein